MMSRVLKTGDRVKLIPPPELLNLLKQRNFCGTDEIRDRISREIGGKKGFVYSIEAKWSDDYFCFALDPIQPGVIGHHYSIPVEAVAEIRVDRIFEKHLGQSGK